MAGSAEGKGIGVVGEGWGDSGRRKRESPGLFDLFRGRGVGRFRIEVQLSLTDEGEYRRRNAGPGGQDREEGF